MLQLRDSPVPVQGRKLGSMWAPFWAEGRAKGSGRTLMVVPERVTETEGEDGCVRCSAIRRVASAVAFT